MKKAFFLLALTAALASCNSNSNNGNNNNDGSNSSATDSNASDGIGTGPRSTDEDTAAKNVYNPINVNGNMPDTTNSINIGTEKTGTGAGSPKR